MLGYGFMSSGWPRVAATMIAVAGTMALLGPSGYGFAERPSTITIRGSKNLLALVEHWVESYRLQRASAPFDVEAIGTSEGIEDLITGRALIAMASRPMTEDEWSAARQLGLSIRETVVARMGIAVVVNRDNPVASVKIGTLAGIFAGEIRDWSSCGGPEQPITVVLKVSGWSPDFFRQRIMGGSEFTDHAVIVDSKEDVVGQITSRPWSVGFTGMPEAVPALDRLRLLRLVSDASDEDSTYALSRPLFFYTLENSPAAQPFLDYVTSSEAQAMILDTGFYPAAQGDAVE